MVNKQITITNGVWFCARMRNEHTCVGTLVDAHNIAEVDLTEPERQSIPEPGVDAHSAIGKVSPVLHCIQRLPAIFF